MKKIIITLFTTLCIFSAMAQNNDYVEMAKEVDQEVWADKDPIFSTNKLPEAYKNESAVILGRKQTVETSSERKGRSLLYVGKMHSTIKRTYRERIFINDQVSLNEYSEINFMQLQSKQNGALSRVRNYTFMGIKVVKPDGTQQKINVDEAAVKLDETKDGKKNKIAVPNLAIGDVIDYYIVYFDQARTDKDLDYLTFFLGDEYPIVNLSIKVQLDKRIAAQYQVINGAPDFKKTNVDDNNILELTAGNLPKASSVLWISETRQLPLARIRYAFADIVHGRGDYTKTGTIEKITSPIDVEHEFVNLIKSYLAQTPVNGTVKPDWKNYAKEHNIDKDNTDSILSFVYYLYRHDRFASFYSNVRAPYERLSGCSEDLPRIRQLETVLGVLKTINSAFDMDAELVLVSGRNEVSYKNIFSIADFNFLLRIPVSNSKFSFYYFGNSLYNFSEIPPSFENENYKFIKQNTIYRSGPDMSQEKADEVNGNAVSFKTSAAENNETEDLVIEFDNSNMQLLNIKRKISSIGHQRRTMQGATLLFEDYWIEGRKRIGKHTDFEKTWNEDKSSRKLWQDVEQALAKARKEQKDKFEKEIVDQYENKAKEFKSYEVLQYGFSGSNAVVVKEEFTMDGWVKKAGNNYILEAGKLVGGQLEIKPDQRKRELDIYMPYARSFNYTIALKIPDGYTVEGVEKLNTNVKNECGGFESTAKVEGNNLLITYYKYYNNTIEPAANWDKILAFVDPGFAFTKLKLLLKKK
ncbi:MAG: hypothetical protein ABIR78_06150 [Ferruginibacter sp.]